MHDITSQKQQPFFFFFFQKQVKGCLVCILCNINNTRRTHPFEMLHKKNDSGGSMAAGWCKLRLALIQFFALPFHIVLPNHEMCVIVSVHFTKHLEFWQMEIHKANPALSFRLQSVLNVCLWMWLWTFTHCTEAFFSCYLLHKYCIKLMVLKPC